MVTTRPLPWWRITRSMSALRTPASLVVRPGDSTLVESLISSATPSLPAAASASLFQGALAPFWRVAPGHTIILQTWQRIKLLRVPALTLMCQLCGEV